MTIGKYLLSSVNQIFNNVRKINEGMITTSSLETLPCEQHSFSWNSLETPAKAYQLENKPLCFLWSGCCLFDTIPYFHSQFYLKSKRINSTEVNNTKYPKRYPRLHLKP